MSIFLAAFDASLEDLLDSLDALRVDVEGTQASESSQAHLPFARLWRLQPRQVDRSRPAGPAFSNRARMGSQLGKQDPG